MIDTTDKAPISGAADAIRDRMPDPSVGCMGEKKGGYVCDRRAQCARPELHQHTDRFVPMPDFLCGNGWDMFIQKQRGTP